MRVSRTNSIMPDSDPLIPDAEPVQKKEPPSDWERLGNSGKYPAIKRYIESRKEYYRHFMPDGTPVQKLSDQEAGQWWKAASTVIAELEAISNAIEANKRRG